ncbi:MAG: hypothetical protein K2Y39_25340 [Candidatus Obscuribacterales bacterium]|nr:hypothetical protein [Candidatus Obscuribacterales bacterium]
MLGNLAFPYPDVSEDDSAFHLRAYMILCAEDIDAFDRVRECANKDTPQEIAAFVNAQRQYRICRHLVHRAAVNLIDLSSNHNGSLPSFQCILRDYLHAFLQFYSKGEYPRGALIGARSYPEASELESAQRARRYSEQLRLLVPVLRQQQTEHISLYADMLESEELYFSAKRALVSIAGDDQSQHRQLTEALETTRESMLTCRRAFIDFSRRAQTDDERAALRDSFSFCDTIGI